MTTDRTEERIDIARLWNILENGVATLSERFEEYALFNAESTAFDLANLAELAKAISVLDLRGSAKSAGRLSFPEFSRS